MTMTTDFYNDPGHATLRHLLQRSPGAAAMLKTAELDDFATGLPDTAFAWQAKRLFPVHTPEHAAVSYLYAKEASEHLPKEVFQFIKEALDVYGIAEASLEAQQTKTASYAPDECLFPESRTYPVRTPGEVKTAEARLIEQLPKLRPETRVEVFTRLAKAAEFHAVKLDPTSYKLAGLTYTDRRRLVDDLMVRAQATKVAAVRARFNELASAVKEDRTGLRSKVARVQLAEAIGTLDEEGNLLRHYDRLFSDPVATVFNTTKVASADDIDLGGGRMVPAMALAGLPPTFFSDLFGKDIVAEIAPGGQVDPHALATVVSTFPADMKMQLAQALQSAGIQVAQT